MTTDSDNRLVSYQQLIDFESLPNLDAGFRRGSHKKAIGHRASRTESAPAVVRIGNGPAERERADVERHLATDRRNACRGQSRKYLPSDKYLSAMRPQDVCRNRVAWE